MSLADPGKRSSTHVEGDKWRDTSKQNPSPTLRARSCLKRHELWRPGICRTAAASQSRSNYTRSQKWCCGVALSAKGTCTAPRHCNDEWGRDATHSNDLPFNFSKISAREVLGQQKGGCAHPAPAEQVRAAALPLGTPGLYSLIADWFVLVSNAGNGAL